jgi:hypothetical protein
VQFAELDLRGVGRCNLSGDLAAAAIENDDLIAGLEAKHVAAMVHFGPRQD